MAGCESLENVLLVELFIIVEGHLDTRLSK